MTKLLSFDEMMVMARDEPEEFEKYRQKIIDGFIANLPPEKHERARQIQWRIDQSVRNVKNPLVRLEIIYGQMLTAFLELGGYLNNGVPARQDRGTADVIKGIDFTNKKKG